MGGEARGSDAPGRGCFSLTSTLGKGLGAPGASVLAVGEVPASSFWG